MAIKKLNEHVIEHHRKLLKKGEAILYQRIVGDAFIRFAAEHASPAEELLDLAECFFKANRRGEDEDFFIIGKVLRRAAHRIYRTLLRKNVTKTNYRFLNVVQ